MAGIATARNENILIDIRYRLINLGGFEHDGRFSSGLAATATKFDDLHIHEFKVGLRIEF